MALSTTQYGYIIDPMVPFTDGNGKTIKDGFVRVFVAGSSTPVVTYRNFDGAANQDLIELDNSGRTKTSVIGSKGFTYKVCVYDAFHSQESPILTVDKVSVIGANITAGAGATLVTGLDGLTTKPDGFVDASVVGTDGYVALDHTLVTDDLDTDAKVTVVENDRYIPLLNEDVNNPDSKVTLGRLWQWVLGKIKNLSTTITAFRTGDVIPVDGPSGTAKMPKDDLLRVTAKNALAGNVAPAFDPHASYTEGQSVIYLGRLYSFKNDHSGAWDAEDVELDCCSTITRGKNIRDSIAPLFVPDDTAAEKGKCYIYNYTLYVAKEDYSGAWDSSKFDKVNVSYYLDSIGRNNKEIFNSFGALAEIQTMTSSHDIGGYFYNDGSAGTGPHTTKCFAVYPGDVLHVRGWGRMGYDACLLSFVNSDYSFNSRYISGCGSNFFYDEIIEIPSSATYAYLAVTYNPNVLSGALVVEKIGNLDTVNISDKVFTLLNDNSSYKTIKNTILNTDGTTTSNSYFDYNLYYVADITKVSLYGTGRNATSSFSWVFLSGETFNAGNIVSGHAGTGTNEKVLDVVDVPVGAKFLAVSINKTVTNPLVVKEYTNDRYSLVNYDETTFTGCVNATLSAVQSKYPNSRIVVCTPLNNGNYYGHSVPYYCENNGIGLKLISYVERIKECASLFACPVIDLNHDLGLNPFLTAHKNTYFSNPSNDNLHPNTAGHKLIANIIIDALKYAIKPFGDYSEWTGKKALFIGDSITSNQGAHTTKIYFEIVEEELGLSLATNGGNSGTGYTRETPMLPCILDRLSNYGDDYDLVVIFTGINDFFGKNNNSPAPFGKLFALE